jgi:hypothetical protein
MLQEFSIYPSSKALASFHKMGQQVVIITAAPPNEKVPTQAACHRNQTVFIIEAARNGSHDNHV